MIIEIILFLLGLVLLVKGSDFLVKASAAIARILRVSDFIIGLSVVALGTSIPELASAVAASLLGDSGLVIGNVVGSNITNIGLVVGLAASFYFIRTKTQMLKRDGFIMLFASVLFFLFVLDGTLGRVDGIVLLFFYIVYMLFLFEEKPTDHIRQFVTYFFRFQYLATIKSRVYYLNHTRKIKQKGRVKKMVWKILLKEVFVVLIGGMGVVAGAHLVVKEAVYFADFFGVASNLIGISLIALGTSLPELWVSLTAARKGYGDIAVGNVIGSNIANIFMVSGIASMIMPLSVVKSSLYFTIPFMLIMSLVLLVFLRTGWRIKRWEGMILVFLYVLLMIFLFTGGVF